VCVGSLIYRFGVVGGGWFGFVLMVWLVFDVFGGSVLLGCDVLRLGVWQECWLGGIGVGVMVLFGCCLKACCFGCSGNWRFVDAA